MYPPNRVKSLFPYIISPPPLPRKRLSRADGFSAERTKPASAVYEPEPDEAYHDACHLVRRYRLLVQRRADGEKGQGQEGALDNRRRAHLPAVLIGVDKAHLQPDHREAEQRRGEVHLGVLVQQVPAPVHDEEQNCRADGPDKVGDGHGRHRVHLLGHGNAVKLCKPLPGSGGMGTAPAGCRGW